MRPGARATLLVVWLLGLAGLGWIVGQRLRISTDLRSFMPAPTTPDQRLLMEQVGAGPGSRLLLLALSGAPDERLAALSQGLVKALQHDPRYSQVLNGSFDLAALDPQLLPYRYLLSSTLDTQPLDEAYLHDQLQQRLDDLASPAASLLKGLLPRDPTLEMLKLAERWAPAKSLELRDGVWFTPRHEALLLVQTVAAGFDPGAQRQALDGIEKAFHGLPGSAGAKLELSGPGYFSVMIGAQTRHQAEWIGGISTVGFIALLVLAYRSVSSLLLSTLPIGFTLLGVAQEYPIRVLSHRRAGEDALGSVRDLWPLLLTAIASACIAYLAFYASGVNGLKQLAVFTIVGLLAAGLSTRYLLPHLLPRRVRDVAAMGWLIRAGGRVDRLPRPRWIPLLVALAIVLMLAFAPGPFWQNDLAALTPVPPAMLQQDARLRAALGAPDVRYLLVLEAPTEQGVLARSQTLQPAIDALVARHAVDAVELPSRYLPTVAVQRERQQKL